MKLRRSVRMSYMYGICSVRFLFGKPLVKNIFSNPSPKKRSVCESQKSGFGLIPRIHPECGFYGFMIRFWIFPKKRTLKSPLTNTLKYKKFKANCLETRGPGKDFSLTYHFIDVTSKPRNHNKN